MTQSTPKNVRPPKNGKTEKGSKASATDDALQQDRPWLNNFLTIAFVLFMANTIYFLLKRGAHDEVIELGISFVSVSLLIWLCKAAFGRLFFVARHTSGD